MIYYSSSAETVGDDFSKDDLSGGGWTVVKPDTVRSVAVYFKDGMVVSDENDLEKSLYVDIYMKAPEDAENVGKRALNESRISYSITDPVTGDMIKKNLPSNTVPLRYYFDGRIILSKTDAETGKLVNITDVEFKLFKKGADGEDDILIGTYTGEDGNNGRIIIEELAYGEYYFIETKAPAGYICDPDVKIPVTIDSENSGTARISVPNSRKDGSVSVNKHSDADTDLPLRGAEFELYRLNDEKKFEIVTDFSEIKVNGILNNSSLVTDESGKLTIEELSWGQILSS